jgi:hypothetical protein
VSDASRSWKRCSSCKKEIGFEQLYWVCNVSTCNRKRTGLVFCTVSCWDAHLSFMNHRESWAEERHSPTPAAWAREQAEEAKQTPRAGTPFAPRGSTTSAPAAREPQRRIAPSARAPEPPREVLIVVSKLKAYIHARSGGMSTSDAVAERLSEKLRLLCDEAIRRAHEQGRKTVMDRDFY